MSSMSIEEAPWGSMQRREEAEAGRRERNTELSAGTITTPESPQAPELS